MKLPSLADLSVAIVLATLSVVIVAMVGAMLWGLYDPRVDNKEIFSIVGPAFHEITGAFIGILAARFIGRQA